MRSTLAATKFGDRCIIDIQGFFIEAAEYHCDFVCLNSGSGFLNGYGCGLFNWKAKDARADGGDRCSIGAVGRLCIVVVLHTVSENARVQLDQLARMQTSSVGFAEKNTWE